MIKRDEQEGYMILASLLLAYAEKDYLYDTSRSTLLDIRCCQLGGADLPQPLIYIHCYVLGNFGLFHGISYRVLPHPPVNEKQPPLQRDSCLWKEGPVPDAKSCHIYSCCMHADVKGLPLMQETFSCCIVHSNGTCACPDPL